MGNKKPTPKGGQFVWLDYALSLIFFVSKIITPSAPKSFSSIQNMRIDPKLNKKKKSQAMRLTQFQKLS